MIWIFNNTWLSDIGCMRHRKDNGLFLLLCWKKKGSVSRNFFLFKWFFFYLYCSMYSHACLILKGKNEKLIIPSRNLLQGGFSITAVCARVCVCIFSLIAKFKENPHECSSKFVHFFGMVSGQTLLILKSND